MKKILFLSYIFLLSMIMLVGCGSKGIVISGQQVVGVGSSITLEAKVSSNEPIVWRSSNKDIATVSKGVVSGISVGEVTIYVTCGKEQASIKIRVVGEQEDKDVTDPYQVQALETISRMSLEQKVGELFVVGVNDASNEVKRLISRFNIGNVILMPHTSSTYEELIETVRELQEQITNNKLICPLVLLLILVIILLFFILYFSFSGALRGRPRCLRLHQRHRHHGPADVQARQNGNLISSAGTVDLQKAERPGQHPPG